MTHVLVSFTIAGGLSWVAVVRVCVPPPGCRSCCLPAAQGD